MIAGLFPEAIGPMTADMRQALDERRDLIEQRTDAVLDAALDAGAPWASRLGAAPADPAHATRWRSSARVIAAYRDRYRVDADTALGAQPEDTNQRADFARAEAAIRAINRATRAPQQRQPVPVREPRGPRL